MKGLTTRLQVDGTNARHTPTSTGGFAISVIGYEEFLDQIREDKNGGLSPT